MEFKELLLQRRTVRKFSQTRLTKDDFVAMLDAARMASCGANNQLLRYIVIENSDLVAAILPHTHYAGRVKPNRDPKLGESAAPAFIAITAPSSENMTFYADAGAAIQSMEFAAWERGIGCCWLGAFDRKSVEKILAISEKRVILYLLAVGYRAEEPVSEDVEEATQVGYYLDENDCLHVPKLSVTAISEWRK